MSHLILTYVPENEFDGELRVSLESAGYSGQGAAWFSIEQLGAFCTALSEFPLSANTPPSLNGGYWGHDGKVLQTHVGIAITPYDVRGSLVVSVELSAPIWEFEGHDLHRSVKSHFRTDYPSLDRFRVSLLGLLASETDAAILHGE